MKTCNDEIVSQQTVQGKCNYVFTSKYFTKDYNTKATRRDMSSKKI